MENRRATFRARVAWSQVNQYHSLTSPTRPKNLAASASTDLPVRSIFKQISYPLFPLLLPEDERQITPERGDLLSDLHYLDHPVNKILLANVQLLLISSRHIPFSRPASE
ncbi:hypothetical protein BJV78DRAFT_513093 [Lactifluus subvellereus]|nr:hypothetical protein BJV78DRAFT_513093 [Lactifluus subvellereus]